MPVAVENPRLVTFAVEAVSNEVVPTKPVSVEYVILVAPIVEEEIVEVAVIVAVERLLKVPVDTYRVIKLPANSERVELTKILLTTRLFSFRSLVQRCLASGPTVNT